VALPPKYKRPAFRAGKRRGNVPAPATAQARQTRSRHLFRFRGLFRYAKSWNPGDRRSTSIKKTPRSATSNLVINGRYQFAIGLSESAGTIGILSQW
jgi:hypothetical protein